MLEPLTRPFKRHYDKYRGKLNEFVAPVKESVSKLYAMIPKGAAFAGSEDLGQEADGSTSGGKKPGLFAKFKDFKKSIKGRLPEINPPDDCRRAPRGHSHRNRACEIPETQEVAPAY